MVVPDRDPGKVLVTRHEVEVSAVCGMSLPVVVQRVDFALRLGNTVQVRSVTVLSVRILVEVVTKVNDVVNRVLWLAGHKSVTVYPPRQLGRTTRMAYLPNWVSVTVEESGR